MSEQCPSKITLASLAQEDCDRAIAPVYQAVEDTVRQIIPPDSLHTYRGVGYNSGFVEDLCASTDEIMRLMVEFEEIFYSGERVIPDEDVERLATVADAVLYFVCDPDSHYHDEEVAEILKARFKEIAPSHRE